MATVLAKSSQDSPRSRVQDVDRHVGARMRARRIMLGLTQQQLADLIGVTYQQAHKYEKGINRMATGRLYKVAHLQQFEDNKGFHTELELMIGSGVGAA